MQHLNEHPWGMKKKTKLLFATVCISFITINFCNHNTCDHPVLTNNKLTGT